MSPPAHIPVQLCVFVKAHAFSWVSFTDEKLVGVGIWFGFSGVVLPGGSGGVVDSVFPRVGVGSGPGVEAVLGGFEPGGEERPGSDHFF